MIDDLRAYIDRLQVEGHTIGDDHDDAHPRGCQPVDGVAVEPVAAVPDHGDRGGAGLGGGQELGEVETATEQDEVAGALEGVESRALPVLAVGGQQHAEPGPVGHGRPTSSDGTWRARTVSVHETYAVTNGGGTPIVRVTNVYRWQGGVCRVSTVYDELTPTALGVCGAVQGVIPTMVGATITRYVPGAGGANDWHNGVDMTSYSTTDYLVTADMASGQPPSMSVDRVQISGVDQAAFVLGYLPDGVRGTEASVAATRLTKAPTNLWEIRGSNKKSYPTFTAGETAGWGRLRVEAIRAYLAPSQITGFLATATTPVTAWDALATLLDPNS